MNYQELNYWSGLLSINPRWGERLTEEERKSVLKWQINSELAENRFDNTEEAGDNDAADLVDAAIREMQMRWLWYRKDAEYSPDDREYYDIAMDQLDWAIKLLGGKTPLEWSYSPHPCGPDYLNEKEEEEFLSRVAVEGVGGGPHENE